MVPSCSCRWTLSATETETTRWRCSKTLLRISKLILLIRFSESRENFRAKSQYHTTINVFTADKIIPSTITNKFSIDFKHKFITFRGFVLIGGKIIETDDRNILLRASAELFPQEQLFRNTDNNRMIYLSRIP